MHELASKAVAMAFLEGDIDVSASNFVYNVVVSDDLSAVLLLGNLVKAGTEILKGFLRVEEPGSSALLVLAASSCADTASTISSLATSSTPSLADGLLFCRSWTVPFCLNLYLYKSLFNDLLWLGGRALT